MVKLAYNTSILSTKIKKECINNQIQPYEIKLLDFPYRQSKKATNTIAFRFCELAKIPRKTLASS